MKVVIVGGTSSIAVALKPKLADFSEVITAGRSNCDIYLDLSDNHEKIVLPDDIDVVIHTAAHFGGKSFQDIIDAENINVVGTLKLCEAATKSNAKHLVYISSIFAGLHPDAPNYSIYALSKKHSEELATLYCSLNQLPLTILRPSHLYGVGNSFKKHQPFFYSIIDKASRNEHLTLYGKNDPTRNFLFIDDLCEIIINVIQQKVTGIYSCAQMKDTSYTQIAETAFKVFETNGQVDFLEDKPNIPSFTYEKDDALYQKIGFFPQINLEEGIRRIMVNS